jgi:hypothetical protein
VVFNRGDSMLVVAPKLFFNEIYQDGGIVFERIN